MSAGGPRVLLGRIAGAHGLRGEVIVHAFTASPGDIAAYGPLGDVAGAHSWRLTVVRVTDKGVIARLSGVTDRTAAEALKGTELWVERRSMPKPEDGEFYHADLVGLAAVAPDGATIGTVVGVHNFGAGDLLELRLPEGRRTELVPFTEAFVPEVDIAGGRIVVVMPAIEGTDPDEEPVEETSGKTAPD
jgi:16S rRNA processing protein RimM